MEHPQSLGQQNLKCIAVAKASGRTGCENKNRFSGL